MKRNSKRLLPVLVAIMLCLSLLPGSVLAANNSNNFYASITPNGFGTVNINNSNLTYAKTGTNPNRVIYGMESAGGVFFTVEGNVINGGKGDDGWRELRMYDKSLTNSRTIGTVNQENGNYWIIDTAMDASGEAPKLYGTYNFVLAEYSYAQSMICTINLETAAPGNYVSVSGLPDMHIIYAIAFDKNGVMYAIGADAGDNGGPASLYTINLQTGAATKVGAIKDASNNEISTNYCQDIAFDLETNKLYWAENNGQKLYTVNTTTAVATEVGTVKYNNAAQPLQNICFYNDTAFDNDKHMISVFYEGEGTVTSGGQNKPFYIVDESEEITMDIVPNGGSKVISAKDNGENISPLEDLTQYPFRSVQSNHVLEVAFQKAISVEQNTWDWSHYNGKPASYYTQNDTYKFYSLPSSDTNAPQDGYTQTLLDESGNPIANDEVIIPGNYDVRITHPGNDEYATLDIIYNDALQLAKSKGTPGRPVVYGRVGCKQSDLATTSYLYGWDEENSEIIPVYDLIPVTLKWQNPDEVYSETGTFSEDAKIYAAKELDERLLECYDLDVNNTIPLTAGCEIEFRTSRVVVLPEKKASIIKLLNSNEDSGTVSGQGVYKNNNNVTVTATANEGYSFKGWQEDNQIVSSDATYTFNANGDRTLTAIWETTTPETYAVTITAGEGMSTTGEASQTGLTDAMTDVVYTADDNHFFPENYSVDSVNGITVTRDSFTQITVSGTPTANANITLPDATAKTKESTPEAYTNGYSETSVLLNGAAPKCLYSIDSGQTWTKLSGYTTHITNVTTEHGIWVKCPTDNTDTRLDSDIQKITITKATTPNASIDYVNEQFENLNTSSTFNVTVDGTTETLRSDGQGKIAIKEAWLGKTIDIVKQGGRNELYSAPQSLEIPVRPSAPTGITATDCTSDSPEKGRINGLNNTMEYSVKGEDSWRTAGEGESTASVSAGEYEVRYKATDENFASASVSVAVKAYTPSQIAEIVEGNGSKWTKGSTTGLRFKSTADFKTFKSVKIDNIEVAETNYIVEEGSTVVTLNATYLEDLSVGEHTIVIVSGNDSPTAQFSVIEGGGGTDPSTQPSSGDNTTPSGSNDGTTSANTDETAKTGDSSNLMAWIILMAITAVAGTATVSYRRKNSVK